MINPRSRSWFENHRSFFGSKGRNTHVLHFVPRLRVDYYNFLSFGTHVRTPPRQYGLHSVAFPHARHLYHGAVVAPHIHVPRRICNHERHTVGSKRTVTVNFNQSATLQRARNHRKREQQHHYAQKITPCLVYHNLCPDLLFNFLQR